MGFGIFTGEVNGVVNLIVNSQNGNGLGVVNTGSGSGNHWYYNQATRRPELSYQQGDNWTTQIIAAAGLTGVVGLIPTVNKETLNWRLISYKLSPSV